MKMKHLHKLIPLGVVLFLAVAFVIVFQVLGSTDINRPKTAQVQTVKVTETYLDWKNSPTDNSLASEGEVRAMKILDIPAGAEILSVNALFNQDFSGPNPLGVDFFHPKTFTLGSLGALRESCRGRNVNLNTGGAQMTTFICDKTLPPLELFAVQQKSIIDSLTQGSMDVFVSYYIVR